MVCGDLQLGTSFVSHNFNTTPCWGFERILNWLREGKAKTTVGKVHPLEQAGLAQLRLETRQTKGKVVLAT